MLLVREIFHCKPGKVRALVEKFQAMAKLPQSGVGKMRLMTDFSGERYWTLVAELEVPARGLSLRPLDGPITLVADFLGQQPVGATAQSLVDVGVSRQNVN